MKKRGGVGAGIAIAVVILLATRKTFRGEVSNVSVGGKPVFFAEDPEMENYGPEKVGKYFSLAEVTRSNTCNAQGIFMDPDVDQATNALKLAQYVLDPAREWLGGPIKVNNWLRSPECVDALQAAGYAAADDTTHLTGGTADVEFFQNGVSENQLIVRALLTLDLPFDRIIIEKGTWEKPEWIHVEYDGSKTAAEQRRIIARISGSNYSEKPLSWAENLYL